MGTSNKVVESLKSPMFLPKLVLIMVINDRPTGGYIGLELSVPVLSDVNVSNSVIHKVASLSINNE